jgi:hypothetical protein
MQTEDTYVPYGPEWEKEMMKLPKKFIIDMLKKALTEKKQSNESDSQHSKSLN